MAKQELRERVRLAIEKQLAYLDTDPDLSVKDRIEIATRLLPFVVSKISAGKAESENDLNDPINDLI
jgi:hypothetical protein